MTYKQLLAMNAPEVPDWFIVEWSQYYNEESESPFEASSKMFFAWREYYADQMIERFGDGEE